MSRPLVSVYSASEEDKKPRQDDKKKKLKSFGLVSKSQTALPDVFTAPIRTDIVNRMHAHLRKNLRHPYAVSRFAGHNYAAEGWGTGRAVSRIPRVPGGGTHRSGQGVFGNMCRTGRMFSPTKTWRKWMHLIKKNERRYAICSAIAASGITALVMGRGHRIERLNEIPFVVTDEVEAYSKTRDAFNFLKRCHALDDVKKVKASKKVRNGQGKARNRRYKQSRGPLVVYKSDKGIVRAFRNIPGVDVASVDRLNLLDLAPGGHVGRFVIWTEAAFKELNARFGTYENKGDSQLHLRNGGVYKLPRPMMMNTDLDRILQSDEIQNALRPRHFRSKRQVRKKNPLKNLYFMVKLNPLALAMKRKQILANARREAFKKKKQLLEGQQKWVVKEKEKRNVAYLKKTEKLRKETSRKFLNNVLNPPSLLTQSSSQNK